MTLGKGGMRIAIIGADGAGKSTLIKELTRWLSWRVDVRTYYMGSSQPFRLTQMVKGISKFIQRGYTGAQRYLGSRSPIARLVGSLSRLFTELRYLSEARDRYVRYKRSCQAAERGALVFYDRYPLDNIRIFNRPVDGPRIAAGSEPRMGWITRALARAEQDLYQRILPPEHVIMMNVRPDVSQARKPEHKWDLILAKSQALQGASRNGYDLTKVDANQPLEEVLRQVKPVIWRLLE
jgi:thymidylate kinase